MSGAIAFLSEWDNADGWRAELQRHLGPLDWRQLPELGPRDDIEVAMAWAPQPGLLASLPRLRLIVSLGMGVDHLLRDPHLPPDVPITRIHDSGLIEQMVDYTLLASLRVLRHADDYDAAQRRGEWKRFDPVMAGEKRVGVMGLGAIGGEIARRHAAAGFQVFGWSRTPRRIAGVHCFTGAAEMEDFLRRSEILICVLPLTAGTRGILNAATLSLLPRGAHVVNVARGGHVVDADLLAALDGGHLAGATLDVFNQEPLPADHPYWRHPKVRVTPHIAGLSHPPTAAPGVAENIRRLARGEALQNLIDRAAGY